MSEHSARWGSTPLRTYQVLQKLRVRIPPYVIIRQWIGLAGNGNARKRGKFKAIVRMRSQGMADFFGVVYRVQNVRQTLSERGYRVSTP